MALYKDGKLVDYKDGKLVDAAKTIYKENKGTQTVKIEGPVNIVDIYMPFGSMVYFMVKWAIASIPALLILMIMFAIFSGFFVGIISILNWRDWFEKTTLESVYQSVY